MTTSIRAACCAVVLLALTACTGPQAAAPSSAAPTPDQSTTTPPATPNPSTAPTPSIAPTPSVSSPPPAPGTAEATSTAKPPSLAGDRRNAWAFAPLDDPDRLVVEGRVATSEAFSTSKVLVVAAFLQVVADGDPGRLSARDEQLIAAALSRSDGDALIALQNRVPDVGRVITRMLRGIGDTRTTAPNRLLGLMQWSVREQVRFLVAAHDGKVVSRAASAYLLDHLRPIKAHAWGLGTIGASAYKGGWLRQGRVTRQFGIVDGYAVAVITDAVGPVVRQTDGDSAHVQQLNELAGELAQRLTYERGNR